VVVGLERELRCGGDVVLHNISSAGCDD
jgi:hypothetical protein